MAKVKLEEMFMSFLVLRYSNPTKYVIYRQQIKSIGSWLLKEFTKRSEESERTKKARPCLIQLFNCLDRIFTFIIPQADYQHLTLNAMPNADNLHFKKRVSGHRKSVDPIERELRRA